MTETIGFIGLGAMGGPMVRRLIDHGYPVVAYDVDSAALQRVADLGARTAGSPADVASQVEIVLVSLPTPDVVRRVASGEKGIAEGSKVKIYIDLSTTGPKVAVEVAEALRAKGITAMDAPVSGGIGGAEKGTLAVMVAGDRAAWERVRPMLEIIGKNAFFVGEEAGQGQTMKLINNLLSATAMAASCEAFAMGAKAGLDPDVMVDVISAGSGRNTAVTDKFPKAILTRSFDYGFRTELMYKDVKLCLEEAEALGVPMWVASSVKQWWSYAFARGGKTEDFTNLMRYVEEPAGVTVRGRRNERPGD
jgi:3-hydroxyisobutyrate dehydrogenase